MFYNDQNYYIEIKKTDLMYELVMYVTLMNTFLSQKY